MESIWSSSVDIPQRKELNNDIKTDVAIIGGGITGVLIGYFLKKNNINCVILEGDRIASGQTKNTTAKITSQHNLKYNFLIEKFGEEKALQYAQANEKAISEFFRIAKEEKIDCELESKPAFLYSRMAENPLEQELVAAKKLGISADLVKTASLPIKLSSALRFDNQAQFHPLKFIKAIAEDITIYENTMVTEIHDKTIFTKGGKVHAEKIVMATHYPFINTPGYYFMRMHQERSYVIALENAPQIDGMYIGVDADGLSFRNSGKYLIIGGGSHRTGENSAGGKYEMLRQFASENFQGSKEVAHWSAQDCIPLDGVPYIGQFSSSTPNIYVATGFQKWGMTSSMISAIIISQLIQGDPHPYEIFSPQRFNLSASAKSLMEDGLQSVKGLATQFLTIPDEQAEKLPKGHGGIVEFDGKKMGVYKDENGEIFTVSAKCPHLGCQLEWNPDELSWDCPCHGSRFDFKGNLIDNPAMKGINEN